MRELRQEEIQRLEQMVTHNDGKQLQVAIYARKSRQDKENASITQQVAACSDFINQHPHLFTLNPEHIFAEDNISGFRMENRKEFQKLLSLANNQHIKVILVTKTDRLSRNTIDTFSLVNQFNNLGIVLISGDDQGDFSASGVFAKQVIAASNEFTVRRAIEDTMAAKRRKAEKGFSCGGPGSYGYRIEAKRYVIDPIESLVVEKVFIRYVGGNSLSEIAETLNTEGYKTRTGKKFNKSRVLEILRNERNYGKNIWNSSKKRKKRSRISYIEFPEVVCHDAVEKPIISKELFNKAQAILNSRTQGRDRSVTSTYFLTGLIKCSCGASMIGNSTRGGRNHLLRRTYICSARKEKHTCSNKDVNADYIERLLKERLNDLLNQRLVANGVPGKILDEHTKFYSTRISELNKEIEVTKKLLEKLVVQKATSVQENVKEAIESSLNKHSTFLDHLVNSKNHLERSKENIKDRSSQFKEKDWFTNIQLVREFLDSQIESIVIDSNNITIKLKD